MINTYLRTSQSKIMKRILVFVLFLFPFISLTAQLRTTSFIEDAAAVPRDHPLDFSKIHVSLCFDAPKGLVIGKVDYQFTSLRPKVASFFLDAIKMQVKELTLNGKPVKYNVDDNGITITPNDSLEWNTQYTMSVSYEASPRVGLYFIGWNGSPCMMSATINWSLK